LKANGCPKKSQTGSGASATRRQNLASTLLLKKLSKAVRMANGLDFSALGYEFWHRVPLANYGDVALTQNIFFQLSSAAS
jgi:hypothetical protein